MHNSSSIKNISDDDNSRDRQIGMSNNCDNLSRVTFARIAKKRS